MLCCVHVLVGAHAHMFACMLHCLAIAQHSTHQPRGEGRALGRKALACRQGIQSAAAHQPPMHAPFSPPVPETQARRLWPAHISIYQHLRSNVKHAHAHQRGRHATKHRHSSARSGSSSDCVGNVPRTRPTDHDCSRARAAILVHSCWLQQQKQQQGVGRAAAGAAWPVVPRSRRPGLVRPPPPCRRPCAIAAAAATAACCPLW